MAYRYEAFPELATGDGFNYPVDVYWDTIYLGLIQAKPNGFVIRTVETPSGKANIAQSPKNMFKSQDLAAEVLHRTWQLYRSGGDDDDGDEAGEPEPDLVPA